MSVGIGRERQFEIYVGGARGTYPAVPVSVERLEAGGAQGDVRRRGTRTSRAAPAPRRRCARTARPSSAGASSRGCSATSRSREPAVEVLGTPLAEPVRPLPDRRARDGASRRGRRGRAGRRRRGHPVRLLQPGVSPDGGDGARDGRRAALVPALLEHVERARREPRLARGALRLQRDRPHARHDDARLADPRPRPRVPAVPPREGHRAVHERPGVRRGAAGDAAPGAAARRAASRSPRSRRS